MNWENRIINVTGQLVGQGLYAYELSKHLGPLFKDIYEAILENAGTKLGKELNALLNAEAFTFTFNFDDQDP